LNSFVSAETNRPNPSNAKFTGVLCFKCLEDYRFITTVSNIFVKLRDGSFQKYN